jgi:hypothetical protein
MGSAIAERLLAQGHRLTVLNRTAGRAAVLVTRGASQATTPPIMFNFAHPVGANPALNLELYVYGYLYRIQSSRRLERECQRNLEVMWLLGRLLQTTRRLPISARTTAPRSRRYVLGSSSSAARWVYWRK